MKVGLGPGHNVLHGDPASPKRGTAPNVYCGPCLLWPNGGPSQLLLSTCWVIGLHWLVTDRHTQTISLRYVTFYRRGAKWSYCRGVTLADTDSAFSRYSITSEAFKCDTKKSKNAYRTQHGNHHCQCIYFTAGRPVFYIHCHQRFLFMLRPQHYLTLPLTF